MFDQHATCVGSIRTYNRTASSEKYILYLYFIYIGSRNLINVIKILIGTVILLLSTSQLTVGLLRL